MTPGPHSRKCTSYLLCGPGGLPLALRLSEGLGVAEAKPRAYSIFYVLQLDGGKRSDGTNQSSMRHRYQTLGIKRPRFEKPRRDNDFEFRPSYVRRVRDKCDKGSI